MTATEKSTAFITVSNSYFCKNVASYTVYVTQLLLTAYKVHQFVFIQGPEDDSTSYMLTATVTEVPHRIFFSTIWKNAEMLKFSLFFVEDIGLLWFTNFFEAWVVISLPFVTFYCQENELLVSLQVTQYLQHTTGVLKHIN